MSNILNSNLEENKLTNISENSRDFLTVKNLKSEN